MSKLRTVNAYLHNGLMIPREELEEAGLSDSFINQTNKRWVHRIYSNEGKCEACPEYTNRHSETCDSCPNHLGTHILAGQTADNNGMAMMKYPLGDTEKLKELYGEFKANGVKLDITDLRPANKTIKPFKMTCELKPFQAEARDALIDVGRGIVQAKPRSGKTVVLISVAAKLGVKTLILAHQTDWLKQFHATFYGSEHQAKLTDIGEGRVKICKTLKQFQETDICLATPQQFMNPSGRKLLEKIKSMFELVMCDEVHKFPAKCSAQVLTRLNCRYNISCTATPERKQEKLINIVHDLVGPVVYEAEVESMAIKMAVLETGLLFKAPNSQAGFANLVTKMEMDKKRQRMIADTAIALKNKGHCVLITLTRVEAIKELTKLINTLDDSPSCVAAAFWGGLSKKIREKTLDDIKSGEIPILVGNANLISVGLNIPRASAMIDAILSSNIPNCDQRVSRIKTPMEGKVMPLYIRVLDKTPMLHSCFLNEYYNCILPRHSPKLLSSARKALGEGENYDL